MGRIKVLDENVINQIAAGEVIERPASVVKELVENSIDAGATKVEVEISQGGRYLRVSDNGSGIHPDDIKLAFNRHATSKIENEKDLWKLQSLGFRGEALASILSISLLTCTTKTKEDGNGLKLINTESGELKTSPIGCANGTTIEISDLFYNVPARLKFMKKDTTEVAAVVEVVQNLAIAHPEVAFICKNQNKIALKTTGSNDLCVCLNEIFSKDLLNHLLMVNAIDEMEKYFVSGVISDPTFTKSNRKSIYIIINGRFVKCQILTKAVEKAFESAIPSGRFPLAVINLMLPADKVDVNVHPTKKEVRYEATNSIFGFIHFAIRKALQDHQYCLKCKKEEPAPAEKAAQPIEHQKTETPQKLAPQCPLNIEKFDEQTRIINLKSEKPVQKYPNIPAKKEEIEQAIKFYAPAKEGSDDIKPQDPHLRVSSTKEESGYQLEIDTIKQSSSETTQKSWQIIGQAFNTYIILQSDEGLQIIDQHIASERAIYDRLKAQKRQIAGQRLLIFEEIYITLDQKALLEEYADKLELWGYEIEFTSDDKISLKQIPQMLTGKNQTDVFEKIISLLEDGGALESIEDNIYKTISCHAAVRAGDILSIKEMEEVISQWKKTAYPYTCPHGRKICHSIPLKELSNLFDRQSNYIGSI